MKVLEEKIINKIYRLETKKTFFHLLFRLIEYLGLFLIGYIFISLLIDALTGLNTFELFSYLTNDTGALSVIYQETPKGLFLLSLAVIVLFVFLVWSSLSNFVIMKNKFRSLLQFWFKRS
jgi:hypothetical protein